VAPSTVAASSSSAGIAPHERAQDDDGDRQRERRFGQRDPEQVVVHADLLQQQEQR
jgi:hypothetical protein